VRGQPASARILVWLLIGRLRRVGCRRTAVRVGNAKGLLSINDLSLALRRLTFIWSVLGRPGNPVQDLPMQRALCPGTAADLSWRQIKFSDGCTASQAEAREALPGCATDLWSARLVLEREKRRSHFCDHGHQER